MSIIMINNYLNNDESQVINDAQDGLPKNTEVDPEHEIAEIRSFQFGDLHEVVLPDDVSVLHRKNDKNPEADSAKGYGNHILVGDSGYDEYYGVDSVPGEPLITLPFAQVAVIRGVRRSYGQAYSMSSKTLQDCGSSTSPCKTLDRQIAGPLR
jgi:hypothetical protein